MNGPVVNLRNCGSAGDIVRIHRPSRWGNPFKIGEPHPGYCGWNGPLDREAVIEHYRSWLLDRLVAEPNLLEPLRGKRLGCWCSPAPCHGDVILEWLDSHEAPR